MTKEEAINKIKTWDFLDDDKKKVLETLIPELVELEDERIKKELITFLKENLETSRADETWSMSGLKRWIAWLEKQGEQKPTDDKIKPKFKVGDWITNGFDCTFQIASIENGIYYDTNDCGSDIESTDKYYRLWTVADAKDGDVLAEDSCIFIIQKLSDNNTAAKTYCTLYDDGDFDDGTILYFDIDSTKPATKEQCDLLFAKMKEAGYIWDSEKKELKKIPVIDEGKAEMDYCFTKMMNGEKVSSTAWSEEDEEALEMAIISLEDMYDGDEPNTTYCGHYMAFDKAANRLKLLEERLKKQGEKTTWSEEDEHRMQDALDAFEALANDLNPSEDWGKLYDWLKSIKRRLGGEK